MVLTCGLKEHTHTVECLMDETADVETASVWEATLPDLTGIWADDVVAVAQSQMGYAESTANFTLDEDGETHRGYTRYGAWYGNAYGGWDAMFVSFCLSYAGVPESEFPEASGAYAWSAELSNRSLYQSADASYVPSAGDLVFFDNDEDGKADHVGILENVSTQTDVATGKVAVTKLSVIEGDYDSGNADAADAVTRNEYSPDDAKIVGYGTLPSNGEEDADDASGVDVEDADDASGVDVEDAGDASGVDVEDVGDDSAADGEETDGASETETDLEDQNRSEAEADQESENQEEAEADQENENRSEAEADQENENQEEAETEQQSEESVEAETEQESEALTGIETELESEDSTESETEAVTSDQSERVFKRDGLTVTVSYGPEAEIPDGAALMVSEYAEDSELWQSRYAEAAAVFGWDEDDENAEDSENTEITEDESSKTTGTIESEKTGLTDSTQLRLFSIYLYEDGQKVQPADGTQVQVTMEISDADSMISVALLSFEGEEISELAAEYSFNEETQTQIIRFSLTTFAQAGVGLLIQTDETSEEETEMDNGTDELTTQSVQGEDYIITVTYGPEAELPEEAVLMVSEYEQDSEAWQARYAEAAELYGWEDAASEVSSETSAESTDESTETDTAADINTTSETGSTSETDGTSETGTSSETDAASETEATDYRNEFRLFKIGFYVDGEEVEPAAEVTVTIAYLGKDGEATYQVTHFSDDGTSDVTAESAYEESTQTITFDTDGFSEYGISVASVEENGVTYSDESVFYLWIYDSNEIKIAGYSEWDSVATASGVLSYTDEGTVYYLIPISYFTSAFSSYGYEFDSTDTDVCPFIYIPDAEKSGVSNATGEAAYVQVDGSWYLRVQDTTGYEIPRSNVYYAPLETVDSFYLWTRTAVGGTVTEKILTNRVLNKTNTDYFYIPVAAVEDCFSSYGYVFDENDLDNSLLYYAPSALSGTSNLNLTAPGYVKIDRSWYLEIQDTTGANYSPRSNLYYLTDNSSVVLNLGNGNGSYSDADYTGNKNSNGSTLRYTTASLTDYADTDGNVTIHLPSNTELSTTFTVVDGTNGLSDVTVTLGKESTNYDYQLVGWINIATGEYFSVENGSTTAEVNLSNANVFYADWIAASYDVGLSTDSNIIPTADTSDFVKIYMFDYNELFNLYSASLTQASYTSEKWADSGSLYDTPLLNNDASALKRLTSSFLFSNNGTGTQDVGLLSVADNRRTWNLSQSTVTSASTFGITTPDAAVLQKLFNTSAGNTGDDLGVYYVGESNYLFSYDADETSQTYGYYSYDSDSNAACYNQSESRFYVYSTAQGYQNKGFYPYNKYGITFTANNGSINEWFGMNVQVDFYLPNAPSSGSLTNKVNQVNGGDMVFEFSGDDDVWVFIDDQLVLDLGGIHGALSGEINFSTGVVTVAGESYTGLLNSLTSGEHTLNIYYMERGGWASNLKLSFNTIPRWKYETATASTISVEKDWGESTVILDEVTMGLFERMTIKSTTPNGDGTTTYTIDAPSYMTEDTYTVDSDGYLYASDGTVLAYYSGGYLYVLIDKQVLNADNNWKYVWELLDSSKTYQVLELTSLTRYETTHAYSTLQSYNYWSVIDTSDLQDMLSTGGTGTKAATIVLSDGALSSSNVDSLGRAVGYVIAAGDSGITIEEILLSQKSADGYVYGAMSDDISQGAIPDTAKWDVYITGSLADNSVAASPQRYTFYLKNGDYYLYVNDNNEVTTSTTNYTEFYYNSLGELQIVSTDGIKVVLQNDNGTVSAVVISSQAQSNDNNIKVYYNTENVATKGRAYTVTNEELPAVYLKKVAASNTDTALSGASFALYKISNDGNSTTLYYSYNASDDETTWVSETNTTAERAALSTDENGWISFYYLEDGEYYLLETAAPDGYNPLTSIIKFTVANGEITAVTDKDGNDLSSLVSIQQNGSGDNLVIQVKNRTEEILPTTGGFGAAPYTLAGLVLLLGSFGILLYRKRQYMGRSPND